MADTVKQLTTFVLDGITLEITDSTARSTANTAQSTANAAKTSATSATNTANSAKTAADTATANVSKIAALPRLTAAYDETKTTLTLTNTTHAIS